MLQNMRSPYLRWCSYCCLLDGPKFFAGSQSPSSSEEQHGAVAKLQPAQQCHDEGFCIKGNHGFDTKHMKDMEGVLIWVPVNFPFGSSSALRKFNIAIENGSVETVSCPINSMVIFHSYVKLPEGNTGK